ncbi:uncharacterized protein LOC134851390 isoform X2 [Symsagittifera roscoffensis]|uniref:uncharacterized protein LOC134851390 isoform X2 n=1 Tax=Symsagittifera roscoffensis TaxID=84072 RepID=UPI00307BE4C3
MKLIARKCDRKFVLPEGLVMQLVVSALLQQTSSVWGQGVSCPACGLVDYSGLRGSEDCGVKMQVAAEMGATYGIQVNGSQCDMVAPPSAPCPEESNTHCLFLKTCATIEDSDTSFGGIYGSFCVHMHTCLRTLLVGNPLAAGMPDGVICGMMDNDGGCSDINSQWSAQGLTASGCTLDCCEASGSDDSCRALTMVDHVGQICVNVTYSSDLGDTSSAAYSDLKNEVMGDAYPYASCTIHSFVTLAIDSAAEDAMCVDGTVLAFTIKTYPETTMDACAMQSSLDTYRAEIGTTHPVQYIKMTECLGDDDDDDDKGSLATDTPAPTVLLALVLLVSSVVSPKMMTNLLA